MRIPLPFGNSIHIYRPGSQRGNQAQQLQQGVTALAAGAPANPGTATPPPRRHVNLAGFTVGLGLRELQLEQGRTLARVNAHQQALALEQARNQADQARTTAEGTANARQQALLQVRNRNDRLQQQLQHTLQLLQQTQVQNTAALTQVQQLTQQLAQQRPPSVDASTSTEPPAPLANAETMATPTMVDASTTTGELLNRDVLDEIGMQLLARARHDLGTVIPRGWSAVLDRYLRVNQALARRFQPEMTSLRLERDLREHQAGTFNFDRLPDLMGLYENGNHGPTPVPHALMLLPVHVRERPLSRIFFLLSGQNGRAQVGRFTPLVMTALRSLPPAGQERALTAGIGMTMGALQIELAREVIGLGNNPQPGSVASLRPDRRARPLEQFMMKIPQDAFTRRDWASLGRLVNSIPNEDERRGTLLWQFQEACPFRV